MPQLSLTASLMMFYFCIYSGIVLAQEGTQAVKTDSKKTPSWSDLPPAQALSGDSDEEVEANPEISKMADAAKKGMNPVTGEVDGLITVDAGGKQIPPGTRVLIVRPKVETMEMLATGVVEGQQSNNIFVELDSTSVIKYPRANDLVTFLGAPLRIEEPSDEGAKPGIISTSPEPIPGDPGYIQLDFGQAEGDLTSTSSNNANAYKKTNYSFSHTHFEWFIEFIWRLGIEYESFAGTVPIESFFRTRVDATSDYTYFGLNYRMRKYWDILRFTFTLGSMQENFTTDNTDENVLSSSYSGLGIGVRAATEFLSGAWKTESYNPLGIQRLFVETRYFPSITAQDSLISRGEDGSGSNAMDIRVGATFFLYFKWIPFIKRFVVEPVFTQRTYSLAFTGATMSETDDSGNIIYDIPENGTYGESISYLTIRIGVRFDDFVGKFFMPK